MTTYATMASSYSTMAAAQQYQRPMDTPAESSRNQQRLLGRSDRLTERAAAVTRATETWESLATRALVFDEVLISVQPHCP